MLVACRLADLSALETYYAGVKLGAQCGAVIANERPRALLLASAGQSAERRGQRGAMARRGLNRALMMGGQMRA
jgi:hypothetical protein